MRFTKNQLRQKGVTLIEIVLILGIIAILSSIILPNYKDARAQFALERSAHKLAQDIRRAAEMALSSSECPADTTCVGTVPPRYGIYISLSEAILFADTNPPVGMYTPGDDLIEELDIEQEVFIKNINVGSPPKTSITFEPPAPTVKIKWDNDGDDGTSVMITLALKSNQLKTKTVTVNKAGLVNVE